MFDEMLTDRARRIETWAEVTVTSVLTFVGIVYGTTGFWLPVIGG